jgi:hypothetical protein
MSRVLETSGPSEEELQTFREILSSTILDPNQKIIYECPHLPGIDCGELGRCGWTDADVHYHLIHHMTDYVSTSTEDIKDLIRRKRGKVSVMEMLTSPCEHIRKIAKEMVETP